MREDNPTSIVHTNVRVFYKIAQESYEAMNRDLDSSRRRKPNGKPGYIITFDPEQKSSKSALITVVFCGVFLESLLHILIVQKHGLKVFKKHDVKSPYEEKLELLGCSDQSIADLCKEYRRARREAVHEKAYANNNYFPVAQKEAKNAIELIDKVVAYFKLKIE